MVYNQKLLFIFRLQFVIKNNIKYNVDYELCFNVNLIIGYGYIVQVQLFYNNLKTPKK